MRVTLTCAGPCSSNIRVRLPAIVAKQRSVPSPDTIDSTPRKRGRNPDLKISQPRSSVSNPKKMSPMAAPWLLILRKARDSASSCAGWIADRYDAPPSRISGA